jgi:hypothetical protein
LEVERAMIIKTTKSAKLIRQVAELRPVIERRALLQDREKELKEYFKRRLGLEPDAVPVEDIALRAGQNVLLINRRGRTLLKREKLAAELGEDLSRFEGETPYAEVTVKSLQDHDPAQSAPKEKAA